MSTIKNRKATHEYSILENFTAGIVLLGSEIKSIREAKGKTSIAEAYCLFIDGELFIRNMHIDPYEKALVPHLVRRDRKLLLTKKELKRISAKMIDVGLTIIPLNLNLDKLVKIHIGIAKGKKTRDKRNDKKEKDIKRELQRANV